MSMRKEGNINRWYNLFIFLRRDVVIIILYTLWTAIHTTFLTLFTPCSSLEFLEGYWIWQRALEKSWRVYWTKHCQYSNQDEYSSLLQNDKDSIYLQKMDKKEIIHVKRFSKRNKFMFKTLFIIFCAMFIVLYQQNLVRILLSIIPNSVDLPKKSQ